MEHKSLPQDLYPDGKRLALPSLCPTLPERLVRPPDSNQSQPTKAWFLYNINLANGYYCSDRNLLTGRGHNDSTMTTDPLLSFVPRSDILFIRAEVLRDFAQVLRFQRYPGWMEHVAQIAFEPSLHGLPMWEIMGYDISTICIRLKELRTISVIFPSDTGLIELNEVVSATYPYEKFPRVRSLSDLELSALQIKANFTLEVWNGEWYRSEWTKSALEFLDHLKKDLETNLRVVPHIQGLQREVREPEVLGCIFLGPTVTSR